jgi:hypothetical protein
MSEAVPPLAAPGPLVDSDNPWPGLAPFRERDQAYFRGREPEIEELRRVVRSQRLTVLFGASGLGKTSLLRAGLFPALRGRDELPVYIRFDFGDTPHPLSEQIFAELTREAAAHRVDAPVREPNEGLWSYLHRREAAYFSERNRLLVPVLVFDQFEEIFTRGLDLPAWKPHVEVFLDELGDLVQGRAPAALKAEIEQEVEKAGRYDFVHHRYRVILSLREDYLALIEGLRERMPAIAAGRYRLLPMNGEQGFRVADQTNGRLVPSDVAHKIVRFAAGRDLDETTPPLAELKVDPSLLGLFCRELNELRKAARLPAITEDLVRRNRGNILESFYEGCMSAVHPELRRFVEDELVTVRGHRDSRAAEDALLRPGVTPEDLSKLVNARLLRIEDRGGTRRIELTHDVLTGVVRAARDRRHAEERIAGGTRRRARAPGGGKAERRARAPRARGGARTSGSPACERGGALLPALAVAGRGARGCVGCGARGSRLSPSRVAARRPRGAARRTAGRAGVRSL